MTSNSYSRTGRRGSSIITLLIVLLVIAAGVGYAVYRWLPSKRDSGPVIISHVVQRGPFSYDVVERGEIESSRNVEVRCEVKAQKSTGMTLLEVVEEGKVVVEGEVLVRLDSSGLEQDLLQQQIKCNTQEAMMITSKNTFEAAKIAKKEYAEGTYRQEEQLIQSEILIAQENLRKAEEYLTYSERLSARGYVTPQALEGDRFAVEKSETELDTGKTKLRVLQEYTKPKTIMQLESDIRSAEAAWMADQSSYKLELANLKIIEEQIEKCVIRAPQAGQVIHANESSHRGDSEFIVEPGATVREGQAIIRLPDSSAMQVKAKVNESQIADLRVGLPATIRIDAYGDKTLRGEVTRVNEYPEPTSWYSSQVKEYATDVQILDVTADLRPGLTAEATIHVAFEKDALLVPIQAVHEHGRDTYCMVKVGADQWEARQITIKGNNDKLVMVDSGLAEKDVVAMNPRKLLSAVDLPELKDIVPVGRDVAKSGGMPQGGKMPGVKKPMGEQSPAGRETQQGGGSQRPGGGRPRG